MRIVLKDLVKRFGANVVIDHVSLEIQEGEMFFLLGPSGCGKTTILRMLAGFFDPDEGEVCFGARVMNKIPPQDRNTALVFQNYAIWPHMTVYENVAYGLRVRNVPAAELDTRVKAALRQVRMEELSDRKPTTLSGGQQQRVALARAMVVKPSLLLFDEPLSNLDAKLRLEMREEIQRIHAAERQTSLYVTHDQEEALSLADRIGVMHKGRLQQVGTAREIYEKPANPFVAGFIGEVNLFGPDAATPLAEALGVSPRETFGFRPENVHVLHRRETDPAPASVGGARTIPATVQHSVYLGSKVALRLTTDADGRDTAGKSQEIKAWHPEPLEPGTRVSFWVPSEKVLRWS
ncbi:MAG: ABC transporter ATP-binding protein [Candidatus Methylacidiphilales bacterium]|nr:ABC transporter ATP-binding protein [Candidatus Methylacidiphilales bacterium]